MVTVAGDLDMATTPELETALAAATSSARLVVDLSECTFLDSAAVRLLVSSQRGVQAAGGELVLVADDPGILRVLEITAVDELLPVHTTIEAAL